MRYRTPFEKLHQLQTHWVMAHFREEISKKYIDIPEYRCESCNIVFASQELFIVHVGVQHKEVIPYVQNCELLGPGRGQTTVETRPDKRRAGGTARKLMDDAEKVFL